MNEELIEKCLLTEKEVNGCIDTEGIITLSGLIYGVPIAILKAQLAKAIPLISAEARKQAYQVMEDIRKKHEDDRLIEKIASDIKWEFSKRFKW